MIKIALLDDHAILRDGIKHLLNSEAGLHVCAECERPSQLEPLLERHRPDLLIIDLNMPEGGGFPLLQRIQPGCPELLVIVLSMHENPGFVSKALSYGVNAYITKTRAADELVLAIRTVLSPRERDVLRALLQGKNPKSIAAELGITDKTLYAHRAHIMQKTQARSHSELQEYALSLGLI